MHGRVYELVMEPEDCAVMTEEDLDDGEFIGRIADYGSLIESFYIPEEMEAFKSQYSEILEVEDSGLTDGFGNPIYKITVIDKEKYFEPKMQDFLDNAEQFSKFVSGDKEELFRLFMGDANEDGLYLSDILEDLNNSFSNDFGDYVFTEGFGLRSMDTFLREVENGDVYYLSTICDYHS